VYESRKSIPVDLNFEARHLKNAILAAEDWIDNYKTYLKVLGIEIVNQRSIDISEAQNPQDHVTSEDDESTIDGTSMDVDLDSRKLAFKKFSHMYNAAGNLTVDFHELRYIIAIYNVVQVSDILYFCSPVLYGIDFRTLINGFPLSAQSAPSGR
jgi:hypothetical protein